MSPVLLFHYLLLNMISNVSTSIFRSLRLIVDLFHVLYCCFVLLTQYRAGDKIKKNEMGWACGAYG